MFDLDEKLECERFGSELIKHMEGKGETSVLKFIFYFFKTEPFVIISRALWDELMCYFFCKSLSTNFLSLGGFCFVFDMCIFFLEFTFEYIQREGLRDPIIFKTTDGLGMQ